MVWMWCYLGCFVAHLGITCHHATLAPVRWHHLMHLLLCQHPTWVQRCAVLMQLLLLHPAAQAHIPACAFLRNPSEAPAPPAALLPGPGLLLRVGLRARAASSAGEGLRAVVLKGEEARSGSGKLSSWLLLWGLRTSGSDFSRTDVRGAFGSCRGNQQFVWGAGQLLVGDGMGHARDMSLLTTTGPPLCQLVPLPSFSRSCCCCITGPFRPAYKQLSCSCSGYCS